MDEFLNITHWKNDSFIFIYIGILLEGLSEIIGVIIGFLMLKYFELFNQTLAIIYIMFRFVEVLVIMFLGIYLAINVNKFDNHDFIIDII